MCKIVSRIKNCKNLSIRFTVFFYPNIPLFASLLGNHTEQSKSGLLEFNRESQKPYPGHFFLFFFVFFFLQLTDPVTEQFNLSYTFLVYFIMTDYRTKSSKVG